MPLKSFIFCCCFCIFTLADSYNWLKAQSLGPYPPIKEAKLLQSKWKYTYTTHSQTNTIVHKADKDYAYYIFFKYDGNLHTFLNGKYSISPWQLNEEGTQLSFEFRKIKQWDVVEFTNKTLILEYYMHAKASYRYHFVAVEDKHAPFKLEEHELPDVIVLKQIPGKDPNQFRGITDAPGKRLLSQRQIKRDERRKAKAARKAPKVELPFVQIELVGGGFYGGLNKVLRNNITIKNDGLIVKELQTELEGLYVNKKKVARASIDSLVAFIESREFFNFQQTYTCQSEDCQNRISKSPRPIALRIAITHGFRRKVVMIPIWDGKGHQHSLIDYPPQLDEIVKAIENLAL